MVDGAHVGVLAHVTVEELRAKLDEIEQANGFANRHLFPLVRRSKLLPSGGNLDDEVPDFLGKKLVSALSKARKDHFLKRSRDAEDAWKELYYRLAKEESGGLTGAVTARSAAQCLRLSVTYALLDGATQIEKVHVAAAAAAWRYCAESARYIFGASLGDPVADRLLAAVVETGGGGLDLTSRSRVFSRNVKAVQLDRATEKLVTKNLVTRCTEEGDEGRPRTVLVAAEYLSAYTK